MRKRVSLHLSSQTSLYLVNQDNFATIHKDEFALRPSGLPQVPLKNEQRHLYSHTAGWNPTVSVQSWHSREGKACQ